MIDDLFTSLKFLITQGTLEWVDPLSVLTSVKFLRVVMFASFLAFYWQNVNPAKDVGKHLMVSNYKIIEMIVMIYMFSMGLKAWS